jgi:hypothetical protein
MFQKTADADAADVVSHLSKNHYQLLWEVLQEFREMNGYLARIADHFDPPPKKNGNEPSALKSLETKIDELAAAIGGRNGEQRKEAYTPKEAAELLPRYKEATLRQACNTGRIPDAFKVGREWRIPEVAVERIASMSLPPPGE